MSKVQNIKKKKNLIDRQSIVKVDNSSDVSAHTNLEVRQHFVEQHKELPKELQGVEAA